MSFIETMFSFQVTVPFAPEQASTVAPEVDALYAYLWVITIFFSSVISLAIIYFAIKYRRRNTTEVPRPRHGSMILEVTWTVIPLLIAMTIFVWAASIYFKVYRTPKQAMEVYVVGKQWMWKFQHQTGQREINELHVPLGARVKLTMTTEDVIHSLYVPAFRIKMDVVPGRYTQTWFEATKPGRFYLFCTEYCGTNHAGMNGYVEVMEPTAYQQWLAGGSGSDSASAQGQKLFQDRGCAPCHTVEQGGPAGRGPNLFGVFGKPQPLQSGQTVVVDEAYVRESILNPQAKLAAGYTVMMPTYQGQLNEEQVLQLIAFIRSLGAEQQGGGAAAPLTTGPPGGQLMNPTGPTAPNRPAGGNANANVGGQNSGGQNANRQQ